MMCNRVRAERFALIAHPRPITSAPLKNHILDRRSCTLVLGRRVCNLAETVSNGLKRIRMLLSELA